MVAVHDGGGGGTVIDYFDLHSPLGFTIQAQGRSIQTLSGDVENFSTDVQAGHNRAQEGVSGLIADAMVGAPQAAITNANNFNAMITSGGGAVIVYGHAIDTFNELVGNLNTQLRNTPEDERPAKKAELTSQYQAGQETLRTAATTARGQLQDPLSPATVQALNAAGGLPTSVQNLFPSVSFTGHEPTELPPDLAELSDSELKEYLLAHPELAPTLLPLAPRNVRESIADDLVAQANAISDTEASDVEVEDVEAFARMLEAFGGDEVVSTRFLNEVGQAGLLQINQNIALIQTDYDEFNDEDMARAMGAAQVGLSGLLAAGTRNISPERADAGESVSSEWIRGLWDEAEKKQPIADTRVMGPGGMDEGYYGYQLLGPLMNNADFDPNTRAVYESRLLDFEQGYADDNNGRLPWESLNRPGGMVMQMNRLDWTHGWDNEDLAGMDPVAGLVRQLGEDPEHAQEFFTHYSGPDGSLPNVEYLLHERPWSEVDDNIMPTPYPDEDAHRANGMDFLGQAFRAATVEGTPDQDSVHIVESIVSSTYEHMPTGEDAGRFSEEDILDPRVREDLAHVMGRYMPSVFTAEGPDADRPVDLTDGNVFNDARFNSSGDDAMPTTLMLAELGKDSDGRGVLTAYANGEAVDRLNHDLTGVTSPDQVERNVTETSTTAANVLGAVNFGAHSSAAEDRLSADETYNQNVDDGVSAVTGLLGETPIGKIPGSGIVLDQIGSAIGDSLHQDHTGQLNAELGRIFSAGQDDHADLVRDVIFRNLPAEARPEGFDGTEDLEHLTASQQTVFNQWRDESEWGREMDSRSGEASDTYGNGFADAERSLEAYGR